MRAWSAALLLASFGLGYALAPNANDEPSLVNARRDSWQLPALSAPGELGPKAVLLSTAPIFEPEAGLTTAAVGAVATAHDKRWRVAGIFGRGSDRRVLVSFELAGKESLRLGVGDAVPSGERIARIEDGEVLIRVGKKLLPLGTDYRE